MRPRAPDYISPLSCVVCEKGKYFIRFSSSRGIKNSQRYFRRFLSSATTKRTNSFSFLPLCCFHFIFTEKSRREEAERRKKHTTSRKTFLSEDFPNVALLSVCVCECGGRKTKANIDFSPVYFHQHIKFYE